MASQNANRWIDVRAKLDQQDGVICRRQLLDAGFSLGAIRGLLESERLKAVFRGVYRLDGVVLGQRGRWRAALLMSGSGVLSHRSSLALHGLIREVGPVTVVRICGSDRNGRALRKSNDGWAVSLRRTRNLPSEDLVDDQGIAAVGPERAVIESASHLSPDEIRSVLIEGERSRAIDFGTLDDRLTRAKGRPGIATLQLARARLIPEMAMSGSELEERTHFLIGGSDLPPFLANAPVGPWIVDLLWPQYKLIVEVDGYAHHSDIKTFELDRRRDRELREMGFTVLRFTWSEIVNQPEMVIETIRRFLANAG